MNEQDELLLTEIVGTLEAWQDEGKDYIVSFSYKSLAFEILAKAKQHYETKLKQAVKDSANNKDIDLPETLYEIFCSIQNQAIRNHEQKRLDRPDREKIGNKINECVNKQSFTSQDLDQILALLDKYSK